MRQLHLHPHPIPHGKGHHPGVLEYQEHLQKGTGYHRLTCGTVGYPQTTNCNYFLIQAALKNKVQEKREKVREIINIAKDEVSLLLGNYFE